MASFAKQAAGALCTLSLASCGKPAAPPSPPATTYALNRCGGPPASWRAQGSEFGELMTSNRLQVGAKGLEWNQTRISGETLRTYLSALSALHSGSGLSVIFEPAADCRAVADVRRAIETRLSCARAVCVEYSQAEWAKAPAMNPPPPCDADCEAYGRAGGSDKSLTAEQKRRLKANYLDKYGVIPW
jgi:hypothetical protein